MVSMTTLNAFLKIGIIYHKGNISKMPDFDSFSFLECKKRKSRSYGKRNNCNIKCTTCTEKKYNASIKDISIVLNNQRRQG